MIIARMICIVVALFSNISLASSEKGSVFFKKLFIPAYGEGREVSYSPHFEVDWKELAPADVKSIEIEKPTEAQLESLQSLRDRYNQSVIAFSSEVPKEFKASVFCYFVSPSGFNELNMTKLKGAATFSMGDGGKNGPEDKIWSRRYSGKVVSNPSTPIPSNESGFSLCAKEPLTFTRSISEVSENEVKKYFLSDRTLKHKTSVEDPRFWKVVVAYSFKIHGHPKNYLFFQLAPDENCFYGCCSSRYFVSQKEEHKVLSWNLSKCDM